MKMTLRRAHMIAAALCAGSFAAAASLYSRLPDPVPTHWNLRGEIDGWTPKPWGAFMLPLTQLGVLVLLALVPSLSPNGFRVDRFVRTYAKLELALITFLALITGFALAGACGWSSTGMPRLVCIGTGLLLVFIGNYLGKTTPNFFVGVRTPWTLASPEVWSRTHRLAGWLFVAGGAIIALDGALWPSLAVLMTVIAVVAIVPVAYSFIISRRIEADKPDGSETHDPDESHDHD
jgi:uncharacterized membrane protein